MELSFNGEEVTPNINRLAQEGIFFSNFYSQVGVGTSSDAEFTFSTSLMPSSRGTVFVSYFDREYISIQKLFKEKGYYTFSMHGNTGDMWNRSVMHKSLGYDDFYSKSSYNIDETIGLGISDKSFLKQSVSLIKQISEQHEKWYGTVITLTNHTPFNDLDKMDEYPTTINVEIDGQNITRDYINGTTLGNYFRSVHYADQALGQFVEELDEAGLLDNTVLVIYGDHDARISEKNYNILYNYDAVNDKILEPGDDGYTEYNNYTYQLDKNVPFIIWTKDTKYNTEIKTPAGMIDALPTLGNMFGISSEYQLGNDILSITDNDNTIVFSDGSYLTDKIYYDSQTGNIYQISNEAVDKNYIDERSEYANNLIEVSNNIITYDLIKELKQDE
jgi:phosphoglycerol transferase MdoB-like AlkP superfamily enzyme